MSNRKKAYNFATKHLMGQTSFFRFLQSKYSSLHSGYVGIPTGKFLVSIFCGNYMSPKEDVDFEPGFVMEYEVTGHPGMFEITSNTPMHPDFCERVNHSEEEREEVAAAILPILVRDLTEFSAS